MHTLSRPQITVSTQPVGGVAYNRRVRGGARIYVFGDLAVDADRPTAFDQSIETEFAWSVYHHAEVAAMTAVLDAAREIYGADVIPRDLRHSRKAGCSCSCSPGFVAPVGVQTGAVIVVTVTA